MKSEKIHTTNYYNTFIEVADDCPVKKGEIPPLKSVEKTVATLQFDMVYDNPYKYTSDEVLFAVYSTKNDIDPIKIDEEKLKFFSKGQPCFRSSPLSKRYGWGIHFDSEGKMAIYEVGSEDYNKLSNDPGLAHYKAMRSKRLV